MCVHLCVNRRENLDSIKAFDEDMMIILKLYSGAFYNVVSREARTKISPAGADTGGFGKEKPTRTKIGKSPITDNHLFY